MLSSFPFSHFPYDKYSKNGKNEDVAKMEGKVAGRTTTLPCKYLPAEI